MQIVATPIVPAEFIPKQLIINKKNKIQSIILCILKKVECRFLIRRTNWRVKRLEEPSISSP